MYKLHDWSECTVAPSHRSAYDCFMNKAKLTSAAIFILSVVGYAGYKTGVGAEFRNALCGNQVIVPVNQPVNASQSDAGTP